MPFEKFTQEDQTTPPEVCLTAAGDLIFNSETVHRFNLKDGYRHATLYFNSDTFQVGIMFMKPGAYHVGSWALFGDAGYQLKMHAAAFCAHYGIDTAHTRCYKLTYDMRERLLVFDLATGIICPPFEPVGEWYRVR